METGCGRFGFEQVVGGIDRAGGMWRMSARTLVVPAGMMPSALEVPPRRVGDMVDDAVAAHRHDDVDPVLHGLPGEPDGVVGVGGPDRLDL